MATIVGALALAAPAAAGGPPPRHVPGSPFGAGTAADVQDVGRIVWHCTNARTFAARFVQRVRTTAIVSVDGRRLRPGASHAYVAPPQPAGRQRWRIVVVREPATDAVDVVIDFRRTPKEGLCYVRRAVVATTVRSHVG